jgi:hypothetical protein
VNNSEKKTIVKQTPIVWRDRERNVTESAEENATEYTRAEHRHCYPPTRQVIKCTINTLWRAKSTDLHYLRKDLGNHRSCKSTKKSYCPLEKLWPCPEENLDKKIARMKKKSKKQIEKKSRTTKNQSRGTAANQSGHADIAIPRAP